MSWAYQSAVHPGDTVKHTANVQPAIEKATLAVHYAWLAAFALSQLTLLQSIGLIVLAQMFSGFMLSLVFVQVGNLGKVHCEGCTAAKSGIQMPGLS